MYVGGFSLCDWAEFIFVYMAYRVVIDGLSIEKELHCQYPPRGRQLCHRKQQFSPQ